MVPIKRRRRASILLRDVARVRPGTMPGEYDRYNMKRLVSMTANIEGEDLGRVAGHIDQALRAGRRRRRAACMVEVRGQVVPMQQMFGGLAGRRWRLTSAARVVVIFLLLTAYFQSVRLALVVGLDGAAVIAGVVAGSAGSPARR